jgi:hypothetical protein
LALAVLECQRYIGTASDDLPSEPPEVWKS